MFCDWCQNKNRRQSGILTKIFDKNKPLMNFIIHYIKKNNHDKALYTHLIHNAYTTISKCNESTFIIQQPLQFSTTKS